jgi:hypothetical protein
MRHVVRLTNSKGNPFDTTALPGVTANGFDWFGYYVERIRGETLDGIKFLPLQNYCVVKP